MNSRRNLLIVGSILGVLLVAFVATAAFILLASPDSAAAQVRQVLNMEDDDEGEQAINGEALEKASAAALDYTGGGQVTGTEIGDEEGYYEVEVTLEDGSQVDVHLDENFNVLGQEADRDDVEDEGEAGGADND